MTIYNLGIGTLSPRTKLDVTGGMQISGLSTLTGGAVIAADVTLGNPISGHASTNADILAQGNVVTDQTLYAYSMMLSSGNTVNAIVTTISSPTNLQIPSALAVSNYVSSTGSSMITAGDTTVIVTDGGATGKVVFNINGSQSMVIDQNGNVGIGSTVPFTTLNVKGSVAVNRTAVNSTPYTLLFTDYYLAVDCSSLAITVNLTAASTAGGGRTVIVKDKTGSAVAHNITITPNGADTIDGAANYVINVNRQSVIFVSDGTSNWEVN